MVKNWHYNKHFRECFDTCKNILCESPILQFPNFHKEFILTTDASNFAIGSVLLQRNDKNKEMHIAYFSKTLDSAEQNYSTIEKELLAIVQSIKIFRPSMDLNFL